MRKKESCPDCKGTGVAPREFRYSFGAEEYEGTTTNYAVCQTCKGIGGSEVIWKERGE